MKQTPPHLPQYLGRLWEQADDQVFKTIKNVLCLCSAELRPSITPTTESRKVREEILEKTKSERWERNDKSWKVPGFPSCWIIFLFSSLPKSPAALCDRPPIQGTRPADFCLLSPWKLLPLLCAQHRIPSHCLENRWKSKSSWAAVAPVLDVNALDQRSPKCSWLLDDSLYIVDDAWRALTHCNVRFRGGGVCLPPYLGIMAAEGSACILKFGDLRNMYFRWPEEKL